MQLYAVTIHKDLWVEKEMTHLVVFSFPVGFLGACKQCHNNILLSWASLSSQTAGYFS